VIDEAYADFADDTCIELPHSLDNVLVMRTFSKSFGLAGMRIGTAVGNPALINEFVKIKDSYNLNAFSQVAGTAAMEDYDYMLRNVAKVRATRRRLIDALRGMGFRVPESQSNYVLAQWDGTPSAKAIFEALRDRAILVRYFNVRRLDKALRISVGSDSEIDALLSGLREILRVS